MIPSRASAALSPVELGSAGNYSVLGGTGVVNTLNTVLNADLGVSPSNSIMGFSPPGIVEGDTHAGDFRPRKPNPTWCSHITPRRG